MTHGTPPARKDRGEDHDDAAVEIRQNRAMDEQSPEPVAPSAPPPPTGWRKHVTPPMVMSTLALFVALGGTGYAAVKLPAKSVGSKQLQSSAVSSSKVKNGSLLAKDFKAKELKAGPRGTTGARGAGGPAGATGAQGPAGATGATGATGGFSSVRTVSVDTLVSSGGASTTVLARCNANEIAVGGGGTFVGGSADKSTIGRSAPHKVLRNADGSVYTAPDGTTDTVPDGANSADGWTVTGTNNATTSRTLRGFVLCVPRP